MATPIEELGHDALAKKGWFGAYKWLILRRVVQVSILGLFLLGPLAGVWILKGNLSSSLLLDTVPMVEPIVFLQMLAAGAVGITTTTVIGFLIVTVFYALVGGRAYCAWVCPVNIVTDTAHWLRRKLGIRASAKISGNARWWMLAFVLVVAAATGSLAWELVNPVSLTHRGIIYGMGAGWAVILGIFAYDLLIAKHGWCGHLCPMGALYSAIGSLAPVRMRSDNRAACDDCMECFEVCPEPRILPPALKQGMKQGLPPAVLSSLCTNCGRCADICAKDVFAFGLVLPRERMAGPSREGAAKAVDEGTIKQAP